MTQNTDISRDGEFQLHLKEIKFQPLLKAGEKKSNPESLTESRS